MEEYDVYVIVARQKTIFDELKRLQTNIKKDGPARKTASYKQKKRELIDSLYNEFYQNHQKIQNVVKADTPYVMSNTYQKVQQLYEEIQKQLAEIPEEENIATFNQPETSDYTINKALEEDTKEQNSSQTNIIKLIRRQNTTSETIKRLLTNIEEDTSKASNAVFLEIKIQALKKYWAQMEDIHQLVAEMVDNPVKEGYKMTDYLNLEREVNSHLVSLAIKLKNLASKSICPSTEEHQSPPNSMVNLPKITLPRFEGDYLKWRQYSDLFTELVHNQQIANCQKLFYLKTTLSGEAEKLIRHFTTSDANYTAAWKVITDRYENIRLLVTAVVNKLLAQPNIQQEGSNQLKALHDTTQECLLSLQNLGIDITNWDPLLMNILLKKLDRNTMTIWEQSLKAPKALPSLTDFLSFLETRFQSLEAIGEKSFKLTAENNRRRVSLAIGRDTSKCGICSQPNHPIYKCPTFLQLATKERFKRIKALNRCINCLRSGHLPSKCPSGHCTKCTKYHHTLLHIETTENNSAQHVKIDNRTSLSAIDPCTTSSKSKYVFLGTAVINILERNNTPLKARALLDSGSQLSFITEKLARRLKLDTRNETVQVSGMGNSPIQIHKKVNVCIQSRATGYSTNLQVYVLKTITSRQPSEFIDINTWMIPKNIQLADQTFNQPQDIDILIGAELYPELISVGQIKTNGGPILQNSLLGWVVIGKTTFEVPSTLFCGIGTNTSNLDQLVQKFWTLEEIPSTSDHSRLTKEERQCEEIYTRSTKRTDDGRFIVKLPFKNSPFSLGDSKEIAVRRFLSLENRLKKNPMLQQQYSKFMKEYQELGHMDEVTDVSTLIKKPHFFLPHHCVLRPESSSTKLRVVFDGSSKTSKNISLNDILHTGPTLQRDLISILLRFRIHTYVFTADISKMYRQILVDDCSKSFQNIIWRNSPNQPLKVYKLNTVTYGTKPAPYLAIRCLQDLAELGESKYPLGATILLKDMYIDDILTGGNNLNTVRQMQIELQKLLNEGRFSLRKWCANTPVLLENIPTADCEAETALNDQGEGYIKTLGMTWLPSSDQFLIKTNWNETNKVTKRSILADIAHIFDPLGIVSPVVILAKMFIQELWISKLDWDAALPMQMHTKWLSFRKGLLQLDNLKIPRHIVLPDATDIDLHAFSDASQRAYGAAIYLRSRNQQGEVKVQLVCSKSRVAPIKQQSIPRLELCAAKLMTQLVKFTKESLSTNIKSTTYWTDSEIVLSWINTHSPLQTFVANRISMIHEETKTSQWKFVNTDLNPADFLSRGMFPDQLLKTTTWFKGPSFLYESPDNWPKTKIYLTEDDIPEKKDLKTVLIANNSKQHFVERINHRNSYRSLQNITAYVIRFISNLKRARNYRLLNNYLSVQELQAAESVLVKYVQETEFLEDLKRLRKTGQVLDKSRLSCLSPFLDKNDIIRVGGRLEASNLSYDAKHQILLPSSNIISKLLMAQLHHDNLHAGPQALLATSRQRYWILRGKQLAQSIVHSCIRCFKTKPRSIEQFMGNLPAERVQPSRPFLNTGVDFLGPVYIHYKIRGKRPTKAYVSVFICFATKAVHLELVTDLTSQAFIGALKRFVARRGIPAKIFSDNATNFIGARNELNELYDHIFTKEGTQSIVNHCTTQRIIWKPIPPRSPHFGGLWEAAVKSAKHHIKRVFAGAALTQEELTTGLAQIEAILNSRPLTPMSMNPNDLEALTPGHFLIGAPLTAVIDSECKPSNITNITRWNLVTSLHREFWRRWSSEYLQEIQQRYKWKHPQQDIKPGTLVLIKDDNQPPLNWQLGRVIKTTPGPDKMVRVVEIKTASGNINRSIAKVCPLPLETQPQISTEQPRKSNTISRKTKASHPFKKRILPIQNNPGNSGAPSLKRKYTGSSVNQNIKISPMKSVLLCLLIIGTAICQTTAPNTVKVEKFKDNSGIYFEDLGEVNLITDDWNLYVYFNMSNYWQEFQGLQESIPKLKQRCESLDEHHNICYPIIDQLEHQLQVTNNLNEILRHRNGAAIRKKRSPFDFIGSVTNKLFGILDQDYARYIEDNIEKANKNEEHLLALIKNQTSIVESTANVLNKSMSAIKQQFVTIKHQLTQFDDSINTLNHTLISTQIFYSATMYISKLMDNFQRTQLTVLESITDTHQGRISSLIVSPRQLLNELDKIRKDIPTNLILPGYDKHSLPKLYELLRVKARVTPVAILFFIKLPLLSRQSFQLFKLIPLPVQHNNSFIYIQPSSPFLAVTPYRDQYFPVSQNEYQRCLEIAERKYACEQRHPIFNTHSSENQCEIQLLNHIKQLSPYCTLRTINLSKMWVQLHDPNNWIFAFQQEETLSILCGTDMLSIELLGTGLLKLPQNCVIKQTTMTITSHNFYISNSSGSFLPALNLSQFLNTAPHHNFIEEPHKNKLDEFIIRGEEDVTTIVRKIAEQKGQESLPNSLTHHDVHQYSIGYLSLFAVVFLTIIIILQRRKTKKALDPKNIEFEMRDLNVGENV